MLLEHRSNTAAFSVRIVLCLMFAGCFRDHVTMLRPAELTGRWVRLQQDGTWSDTISYLADGRVLGSTGHPIAESVRWTVVHSARFGEEFCETNLRARCHPFRLEGDTLVVGPISDATYFRRAR